MTAAVIPIRRAAPDAYLDDVFAAGGPLARAAGPGRYEVRPGQLALARAVDAAIRDGRPVLAEGPCGTGKSVAYLVPATYRGAEKRVRVVVSTASIALQEQLVDKDLPALQAALPWRFTFALLKGRGNYLCNARRAPQPPRALQPGDGAAWDAIARWARTTTVGDKAALGFVPVERLWRRFTVTSDDCEGKDCEQYASCFYEGARGRAAAADVLVVNHHLLCADTYLRSLGAPPLLPNIGILVIDEAHELAEVAREFWGGTIGPALATRALKYVEEFEVERHAPPRVRQLGDAFAGALEQFLAAHTRARRGSSDDAPTRTPPAPIGTPGALAIAPWTDALEVLAADAAQRLVRLDEREDSTGGLDRSERKQRAKARTAARVFTKAASWLRAAERLDDENLALWVERDGADEDDVGPVRLQGRTLDVGPHLAPLFERVPGAVLTSATLTAGGSFDFIEREIGLRHAAHLEVPSPFDFASRCLLVVPDNMPLPDAPAWPAACIRVVRGTVAAADGRTLALFSSRKNLEATFAAVATTSDRMWLKQGQLPARILAGHFKRDARSVLFGTKTFWAGVDVPGESLVAVFIDRIPFPQREDPVVAGLRRRAGDAAFERVDLPRALMQLRQGFGRLIRTRSDYGVVVLGDRRVFTKGWGRAALASLPTCARGRSAADVAAFLARFRERA